MSFMSFMVSFNIVSNTFNLQPLGASYCSKKKKIMYNLPPWMFLMCFFDTLVIACYFVVYYWHSLLFVIPIFHHPWHYSDVLLLLTKIRSFMNQNIVLIWILTKDVWIWECMLSWVGTWPNNNHNDSKTQKKHWKDESNQYEKSCSWKSHCSAIRIQKPLD